LAEQEQTQDHKSDESSSCYNIFKANIKVGPQFRVTDDDELLYKIKPDIVETVTTPKRDRIVRHVFCSGNRGKPTIHLPEHWKDRLGIHYDDEGGGGTGHNLVELVMDENWDTITIRKLK
jgi:hypothetical protein